ncbi:hypothetical protein SDC9_169680 [bioreactor metagenome]|uniref:Uncharacterized protein n=1 Tax=bioreactor metagenome TaxID=1076179 RepID=A0A645G5U8_9ZZZZ
MAGDCEESDQENFVARRGLAVLQHDHEDPFPRHHAVPGDFPDFAALVTFLADLRDFAQCSADAETGADGQFKEDDAAGVYVFREDARMDVRHFPADLVYAFFPQQADLAVPGARMGIALDAVAGDKANSVHRIFNRAFFLTDID